MPTKCIPDLFGFTSVEGHRVFAAFDGGSVTSDAGARMLGAADLAIGLIDRFFACFDDGRMQGLVIHRLRALITQRVIAIALGYEDVNDHDTLRFDPVLGALAGSLEPRDERCAVLAGKSTLNRLELAP